jgi:hypothetical protein
MGILALGKKHGSVKLLEACKRANKYGIYSLKRIKEMIVLLKEEQEQLDLALETKLPVHENIRGSSYYN